MSAKALRDTVDCSNAINRGSITLLDIRNSALYGRFLWNKGRCDDLSKQQPKDFQFVNRYTTGETSYFCPTGLTGCYEGTCLIISEDECLKHSEYPFSSDPSGEASLPSGQTGPTQPYLEFRQDKNFPQAGNNCYFGNNLLRRWCTSPGSRSSGKTDVNPFFYNIENGNCYTTQAYCKKSEGLDYESPDIPIVPSLSQANKDANPTFANLSGGDLLNVGGDCTATEAQKILGALFGQTLTRVWTSNCLSKLSDRKLKKDIGLIKKDYGGEGVHLYTFTYHDNVKKMHPEYKDLNIGFMADELKKKFPELVKRKNGIEYIEVTKDQCKDKKYWRIANTLMHEKEILKLILNKINEYTSY